MNSAALKWSIAFIPLWVIIFATTLGPEEFFPKSLGEGKSPIGASPPKAESKRSQKAAFPLRPPAGIDHDAFITSFRRQAMTEVLPCLRSWQNTPASALVTAVLAKGGKLENFRLMDQSRESPPCLISAVEKMDFSNLTVDFDRPSVQVRWRIDW